MRRLLPAVVVCFLMGIFGCALAQTPWEDNPELLIYRMWEIQVLLLRDTESLNEGSQALSDEKKATFADKLRTLDCNDLPELARDDCAVWRGALLGFLVQPPAAGYERGYRIAQITSENFVPILVDLDITEQKASEDLHLSDAFENPDVLAATIGGTLNLERAVLMLQFGLETECPEGARLEAYEFVVYQLLVLVMYGEAEDGNRPVRAQAALLAKDPTEVVASTGCDAFADLHDCLLKMSRAISRGDLVEAKTRLMASPVYLSLVVKKTKLSDQDVIDAGGEMLLDYVQFYRNL
jgi:hypothetical protein